MNRDITIIRSFSDNYIYVMEYAAGLALVVDPGQPQRVLDELRKQELKLTHILITHRHTDHTGGIGLLKKKSGCVVVAGAGDRIPEVDKYMHDGQTLMLDDMEVRCMATPGHTAASVCWYLSAGQLKTPVLFTGDTLFVCGCGRVFESDGKTMLNSLRKLAALPDETLVYPGHDYTEENLRFALVQKPEDPGLLAKLNEARSLAASHRLTVPSRMADEKQLNPFLTAPDAQTFTRLRQEKDVFQ